MTTKKHKNTYTLHRRLGSLSAEAWTRGEARAEFKRQRGINRKGRLPPHSVITVIFGGW